MIVYKVVHQNDKGEYESAVVSNQLKTKYVLGTRVEAPVGGLFCFVDYARARLWAEIIVNSKILRCRTNKQAEIRVRGICYFRAPGRNMRNFWKKVEAGRETYAHFPPYGTSLFRYVTPLKEME